MDNNIRNDQISKDQQEVIDRVMRASRAILETYQQVNMFLDSTDEFRAAVGLAQIASGLSQDVIDGEKS